MPLSEEIHLNRELMIQPVLQAYIGDPSVYTRPHYVHRIASIRIARLA